MFDLFDALFDGIVFSENPFDASDPADYMPEPIVMDF